MVAIVTGVVAATPETAPSLPRVVVWSFLLSAAFGVGRDRDRLRSAGDLGDASCRAWLRAAFAGGLRILAAFLIVSTALFLVALALDLGTAVNVMSRLHTGAGDATIYTVLSATLVPNAALFAGSYLLGPGFLVGTGTVVSPALVSLGPVPMFPLLAALPDNGPTPAWATYLLAVPPLLAAVRCGLGRSGVRRRCAGRRAPCAAASAA